jgi:acetyltransferase-like isoleucine patch superfamily enzyme
MVKLLKILARIPCDVTWMLISNYPGELGVLFRYWYMKRHLKFLGKNVVIDTGVYFQNPEFISIGDNCWIDKHVIILAGLDSSDREKIKLKNNNYPGEPGEVFIGENVHVGPGTILSGISAGIYISDECGLSAHCKVYSFTHHYRSKKEPSNTNFHFGPRVAHDRQCLLESPIYLGPNTGVALNSMIFPGVSIEANCFVAINSVVHKSNFSSNSMIAGNPAKKIGERFKPNA